MSTDENVDVRCLACMTRFVTGLVTAEERARAKAPLISCPACGHRMVRPVIMDDGLLTTVWPGDEAVKP